jgi:hypothetical protein
MNLWMRAREVAWSGRAPRLTTVVSMWNSVEGNGRVSLDKFDEPRVDVGMVDEETKYLGAVIE